MNSGTWNFTHLPKTYTGLVSLHMPRLDMRRRWSMWLISITTIGLFGCQATSVSGIKDSTTDVEGTVTKLIRAENGSFRYYGKVLLRSPSRYHTKEVGLFIISHERDAREFIGKTISARFGDGDLAKAIEPAPNLFSVASPEPQLSLELSGETFSPIEYSRYVAPVTVRGIVHDYQPEKNKDALYFMFDVGYSGDLATVEVVEPVKYRGLIVHVVVSDRSIQSARWRYIGAEMNFSVSESVLAWEPWGFVPIDQLGEVIFQTEAAPTAPKP